MSQMHNLLLHVRLKCGFVGRPANSQASQSVIPVFIQHIFMHSCLKYDPVGRPPEAAWGALQKLRHSVRSHPLKGVEPELYSPEELLGGSRRPQPSSFRTPIGGQTPSPQQVPLQNGDAEVTDQQPSTSWFQLPWRISQQDDAPSSRRISGHDRGYPLNQPPMVGVTLFPTKLHGHNRTDARCLAASVSPILHSCNM